MPFFFYFMSCTDKPTFYFEGIQSIASCPLLGNRGRLVSVLLQYPADC